MKLEQVNSIIDGFFNEITPGEVVKLFQEIGYEFEPNLELYELEVSSKEVDVYVEESIMDMLVDPCEKTEYFIPFEEKKKVSYSFVSLDVDNSYSGEDRYIDLNDTQFAMAA